MAADQAHIKCPGDENDFLAYLNEPRWYQYVHKHFPWAYEESPDGKTINWLYPPEQIHDVLALGFNAWTGRQAAEFGVCRSRLEVAQAIIRGCGVVLSGKFPYKDGRKINHIVSLAGFDTAQADVETAKRIDVAQIKAWRIDDPYGNHMTGYEDKDGDDNLLTLGGWAQYIKGDGVDCKWVHILSRR